MISEDIFEELITVIKGCRYNKVSWYSKEYYDKGIPMIYLYKFKPKRKDENGNWTTFESEPYMYMIILSVNTGIMFGGDGHYSNDIHMFTPDFAKAIYSKIFELIPQLEINADDKIRGLEIYWNTEKQPQILKDYYSLNAFKLRRIDYTLDIYTSHQQYMKLIEYGKGIRRKSYEQKYFDTHNTIEYIDDIDDEEPDLDDIDDELFQEFKSDTKYIYYKSKSLNINIYLKGEQLKKNNIISANNTAYDFLRIEIQVKKNKLNAINQKKKIHGREFHMMPIPEIESDILHYYINELTGTGIYVTCEKAMDVIDTLDCKQAKKERLQKTVHLVAQEHGLKNLLDKIDKGTITDLGKPSTVRSYIRDIRDLNINPVTISKTMSASLPKSTLTNLSGGKNKSTVALPSLVDIVNAYNKQMQNEIIYKQVGTPKDNI